MHETILALVTQMPVCSGLGSALLGTLVSAAQAELECRLPEDVSAQSLGVRFTTAAAMLAASMAVTVSESGESMKAGNLSITKKESGRALASALRNGAHALLAGVIPSNDFAVLEVTL